MSIFDELPNVFTEAFGELVVYTPAGGTPITITAIPIDFPISVALNDGAPVDDIQRTLHLRAADVPDPKEGAHAVVRGTTYKVVSPIQPDGRGMIAVTLVRSI